ncbi:MAG: PAS domain-containing protein [Sphingomonadaceae bacterium]
MHSYLTWLQRSTNSRLGRRMAVQILLFSSLVTLASTAAQLGLDYRRDLQAVDTRLQQIRSSYADSLAASLWTTGSRDLEVQLQGILRLPDLQYIEILDEQGKLVARAGSARNDAVVAQEFPLHFTHRGQPVYIGQVRVVASTDGAWQRLQEQIGPILIEQSVRTFLVSLFALLLFQWLVGRHLKKIAAYSDRLCTGSMSQPLELERPPSASHRHDELAQVVAALNAMRGRLDSSFRQLQDSEFRWKAALESAGHGVWDFHIQSGTVLYSRRWMEMLGYADGELPNHLDTYRQLAHPDDQRTAFRLLEANFNGSSKTYAMEQRMRCKDGSWKWVVARGMVIEQDGQGRALRMIGTHTDFTERRAAELEMARLLATAEQAQAELRAASEGMEQQVRDRTAQLERANRELEAFSYSVSHDLRSPLRGIAGWTQALQEDYGAQLDERGRSYLARVGSETLRMGQLIDNMLEFARLGRAPLHRRQFDLSALARTVAERIRVSHPQRAIEFDIPPGLQVRADERLLEALLGNLLDNASKFSAQRAPARIAVGQMAVLRPGTETRVTAWFVRDNGAGFDMQYAAQLFGVFQRLHSAADFPGTGIGLASVQRIVQRHGGQVWADASVNGGATFFFTLGE